MPVIGYLSSESLQTARRYFEAFHRGLAETGYIEGRNVAIEYRLAGGRNDLVTALAAALGNRAVRPRGKLVLGFRKEWLAELDRRLAEAKLPRTNVFLQPLDRRGIIEAIRGPTRPGRLYHQYRLAIEDGLPEVIADNLLADAGSARSSATKRRVCILGFTCPPSSSCTSAKAV